MMLDDTSVEDIFYTKEDLPRYSYRKPVVYAITVSTMLHVVLALCPAPSAQNASKRSEKIESVSLNISLAQQEIKIAPSVKDTVIQSVDGSAKSVDTMPGASNKELKPLSKSPSEKAIIPAVLAKQSKSGIHKSSPPKTSIQKYMGSPSAESSIVDSNIFDPRLRGQLQEFRKQKYSAAERGEIYTFDHVYGFKTVVNGDLCFDVSKEGVWSLPKKCYGAKNESEKMADRIRDALKNNSRN